MKKLTLLLLLLSLSFPLFSFTMYISPLFTTTFDTNYFSNPLPQDADVDYLEWKNMYPFESRVDLGGSLKINMYFEDSARTGLSILLSARYPIWRHTITPHAIDDDGNFIENGGFTEGGRWDYVETSDISSAVPALYFALGPSFRFQYGVMDIGFDVRLSVGSRNLFQSTELGVQAEPYINIVMNKNVYFTFSMTYDAHFYNFIQNDRYIYEPNFFKLSLSANIGFGFLFGGRSGHS